jgi:hypothetical protein
MVNHTKSILLAATALTILAMAGQTQAQTASPSNQPSLLPNPPTSAPWAPKMQITMRDGEVRQIYGTSYRAKGPTQALAVLSSEFATLAVISGTLAVDQLVAKPGQALVTPISGRRTERFTFDAARLSATLRPEWVNTSHEDLNKLAVHQRRNNFWGLYEATGVNVTSPTLPAIEAVRATYLTQPAIVVLRQEARGNLGTLATATMARFARAIGEKDIQTIAALIDPYPFTDASDDPSVWQAARIGFAQSVVADEPLAIAVAQGTSPTGELNTFLVGSKDGKSYRLTLVERDRVLFVASVETQS